MTREEILEAARQAVTVDRAATHGDAESNFALIGALWSAYLGVEIKPHDVAALMSLFKVARIKGNPAHADNWLDLAGYAACGGEVGTNERIGDFVTTLPPDGWEDALEEMIARGKKQYQSAADMCFSCKFSKGLDGNGNIACAKYGYAPLMALEKNNYIICDGFEERK